MKKLFGWIDSLINRLATNVTLWIVAGVVVLIIVGYSAYSAIFIRLPQPPVYGSYMVLEPQRQPCRQGAKPTPYPPQAQAAKPTPGPQGETPQPTPGPQAETAQAKPGPTVELPPCQENKTARDQWTDNQRERYYQTSQGSLVIPYAWFRALESRTDNEMFAAPSVQARYGLLPDNNPTYNKDLMPVGIVKNVVRNEYVHLLGDDEKEWASISCAACHTGQLTYRGTAMRIDGGQSFWNFDKWSSDLVFSLMLTSMVPERFERFCGRVNGLSGSARCTPEAKKTLRQHIYKYLHSDLVINAINAILQHTYPTTESFTRTAALGRGINGIFGPIDHCRPGHPFDRQCERNVGVNTGPVSFPPLWYTHEYDWVQSTTQIRQPLGRNVTESWGVSVHVELNPETGQQFASTHNIDDMFWMETLLSILQAPKWPEDIFSRVGDSGKIDWDKVKRGEFLYNQAKWPNALSAEQAEMPADNAGHILGPNKDRPTTGYCARCHAPAFEPPDAWPTTESTSSTDKGAAKLYDKKFLQLPLYRQNVMDTDPDDAKQFAEKKVHTTYLEPLFKDVKAPDKPDFVGIGTALSVTITKILDRWFGENNISGDCRQIMQGHRQNLFRAPVGYPARPLDGYWATGPFLHNGSVRTIYELLSPVPERAKTFWLGTREFDPVYLGFQGDYVEGAFLYDTSLKGNHNSGHEFQNAPPNTSGVIGPYLSPEDRLAIIEYLKVMRSVQELLDANPATKDRLRQRNDLLDAMSPFYEDYKQKYQTANGAIASWVEPGNRPQSEGGFDRKKFCQDIEDAANKSSAPSSSASPYATPATAKK